MATTPAPIPRFLRARGEIRASFACAHGRTHVARVHEAGGLRLRFPHVVEGCEAVIVNTAGGIASGDTARFSFDAGAECDVTITTQAAEKIYRADAADAELATELTLGDRATLDWLPQEAILFNGARLRRSIAVDMPASATLTMVETLVFGRLAMGEARITGALRDTWRLRRDGRLIFAENLALAATPGALLDRPAIGGGARAAATLVHVGPRAETVLEPLRAALAGHDCEAGVSAWNGMVVARLLSPSPPRVRGAIVALLSALRGRDLPRVWQG